MSSFEDSVRAVLADTMNLPPQFLDYMIQYQAINPGASSPSPGEQIGSAITTSNVSTIFTTFAAGTDVLATPISFSAQGGNSYLVRIAAKGWSNSVAGDGGSLNINLDGADAGSFALYTAAPTTSSVIPLYAGGVIVSPPAGSHTVNVRLVAVTGGTCTILGGPGGSGANSPIRVALYRI